MEKIEFQLTTEYIELIKLLKFLRIAESGGHAKLLVDNGEVLLNGNLETRKRAKIKTGDKIEVFNFEIVIT
jgi:ribosome-associated protein